MALINSSLMYIASLRPLALPRVSTIQRFLSSTSSSSNTSSTSSGTSSTSHANLPPTRTSAAEIASAEIVLEKEPLPQILPYRVYRTPTANFPVYPRSKRGGNLHQTKLQKIEGDIERLRIDLRDELRLEDKDIVINQLTKQIIVRGFYTQEIRDFLRIRGF